MKLLAVMTRLDTHGRYLVVESHPLLDMISLEDLREFTALKLELESQEG